MLVNVTVLFAATGRWGSFVAMQQQPQQHYAESTVISTDSPAVNSQTH